MILQTERLIFREFTTDDAQFILELLNSPGWLRWIGDRGVHDLESARNYILRRLQPSYLEWGFGFYKVELKSEGTPIGMCGLVKRPELECPDIGFALLPGYAGKGYGYEAAAATLNWAVTQLKLPRIAAITDPENEASIGLLEKIGLQFRECILFGEQQESLHLFWYEQ